MKARAFLYSTEKINFCKGARIFFLEAYFSSLLMFGRLFFLWCLAEYHLQWCLGGWWVDSDSMKVMRWRYSDWKYEKGENTNRISLRSLLFWISFSIRFYFIHFSWLLIFEYFVSFAIHNKTISTTTRLCVLWLVRVSNELWYYDVSWWYSTGEKSNLRYWSLNSREMNRKKRKKKKTDNGILLFCELVYLFVCLSRYVFVCAFSVNRKKNIYEHQPNTKTPKS